MQEVNLPSALQGRNLFLHAEELTRQTLICEMMLRNENTFFLFCLTKQPLSLGPKPWRHVTVWIQPAAAGLCWPGKQLLPRSCCGSGQHRKASRAPRWSGMGEPGPVTLCFVVNEIGAGLGHGEGDMGVPVILVTHLFCLDV